VIDAENQRTSAGSINCQKDWISTTAELCPNTTPLKEISVAGTAVGYILSNGNGLCIDMTTWNPGHSMSARYDTSCSSTRVASLQKIMDCVKDLNTKTYNFRYKLRTEEGYPNKLAKNYYSSVGAIKQDYITVNTAFSESSGVFKGTTQDINEFLSCKKVRDEVRNHLGNTCIDLGNTCIDFGKNFAT
jgi:hypothetical protein